MYYFFPKNIFSKLIADNLSGKIKNNVSFTSSSLISSKIKNVDNSLGLIPVMDLIYNKDFYVSQHFGISFESSLCNTYLYFYQQNGVKDLYLLGDVSTMEVVLSKILFKEIYSQDIEIHILTDLQNISGKNLVIAGDINFKDELFKTGISFAEEMIEIISLPYVNYVLASKNKTAIEEVNNQVKNMSPSIYKSAEENKLGANISDSAREYIKENISSLICEFNDQDIEGLKQIIRLPYYHGIIDDIVEVKFV